MFNKSSRIIEEHSKLFGRNLFMIRRSIWIA